MEVTEQCFESEEEATRKAEAAGLFPITLEVPADDNESHWHDFNSEIYILEGELQVTESDSGKVHVCKAGGRLRAPAYMAHSEVTEGYRAVIGFSTRPEKLTQPLNKPMPVGGGA